MRLFIAEKPELARAIVEGLGGGSRKEGYFECSNNDIVTWCFGHMLQLLDPEEYDAKYKEWRLSDLPLSFVPWKKRPVEKSKKQLQIIVSLIREADSIVHAGDPDAEGQLLVDEIVEYANFKKPVKRVLINDNTTAVVKKSLANLRDNSEFAGLSAAAEARQVGDQCYGYSMTRLYTLAARQAGFQKVLSVGRVQTPILGLVVRRDREHSGHQSVKFYDVCGQFVAGGLVFPAQYQIQDGDPVDDKGRLREKDFADQIVATVKGKACTISEADSAVRQTPPPLPYNLLKLQTDAARLYGLKPNTVKDITQVLREKHRLITYNRSDCQYLSEEQHNDAPGVLAAIAATNPILAEFIDQADTSRKNRAFDSTKVTAHHAIIPTAATANLMQLSNDEQKIYNLIARAYIAQFLAPYKYEQTKISVVVEGHTFACTSNVPLEAGWKNLYGDVKTDDEKPKNNNTEIITTSLKSLHSGQAAECAGADVFAKDTKPKPLYTMASLLTDLTRVAQYVKDDKLRKLLLDKDKGKSGEHGGIGTPATRDSIIALLFKRGFIEERKAGRIVNIVSTKAGQDFYDTLPDQAKYPDMTAVWHGQQKEIEAGVLGIDAFMKGLVEYLHTEVARVNSDGLGIEADFHACPTCGKAMVHRTGKNGVFWACTGYPECKTTLPDDDGKPGVRLDQKDAPACPDCGKPMRLRKGSNGSFFGCSGYPECKQTVQAKDGKPVIESVDVSEIHNCMACGKGLIRRPSKNGKSHWWGCSGYPACGQRYFDDNGKPNYGENKKEAKSSA